MLCFAQQQFTCPWNEVNCRGKCGRFLDTNGYGYCDYGRVLLTEPTNGTFSKDSSHRNDLTKNNSNSVLKQQPNPPKKQDLKKIFTIRSCLKPAHEANFSPSKRRYNFFLIGGSTLAFYIMTSLLATKKIIKKSLHFKLWNWLLLLTFLVTGLLGFLLVFQINYEWKLEWLRDVLYFHVQFGIAMGSIAFYHIWWHRKYFLKIWPKQRNEREI